MPRIDGTDELSRRALTLLEQGHPLSGLEALGLTKDQAKKLSRLRTLLAAAKPHLTASAMDKLQGLGLRAVSLAPLVQAEDWDGLEEFLQSVDLATVKRSDLEKAPALLAEKRTRVAEAEQQMKNRLPTWSGNRRSCSKRRRPSGSWSSRSIRLSTSWRPMLSRSGSSWRSTWVSMLQAAWSWPAGWTILGRTSSSGRESFVTGRVPSSV